MKQQMIYVASHTASMLGSLRLDDDARKVRDARDALDEAIKAVKDLDWDSLFSLTEAGQQNLTTHQQAVLECYAKLKRVLLQTYKEMFDAIKGF